MRRPAQIFAPATYIREEMEERGWSVDTLAALGNARVSSVEEVLSGGPLRATMAKQLGRAFGMDPKFWMNLEAVHRYWLVRGVPAERA